MKKIRKCFFIKSFIKEQVVGYKIQAKTDLLNIPFNYSQTYLTLFYFKYNARYIINVIQFHRCIVIFYTYNKSKVKTKYDLKYILNQFI